jgi:hypothetical protein
VKPFILSCTLLIRETNEAPVSFSSLRAKIMAYQQYLEHNTHTFQSEKKSLGRGLFRTSNYTAGRSY